MIAATFFAALLCWQAQAPEDARLLVATIESLQHPVDDFRCEVEGRILYYAELAEESKLGPDEPYMTYSGNFVWRRGGDMRSDTLWHTTSNGRIVREKLVVRMGEHEAEEYRQLNDAPLGGAVIKSPEEVNSWRPGCMGTMFLADKLRRLLKDEDLHLSVGDDEMEGRSLKVLNVALKDSPKSLVIRYWVDLRRNGHVVRQETYLSSLGMANRLDITLRQFNLGNTQVWMPVKGETVGYVTIRSKKPVVLNHPVSRNIIFVVSGTMEFNRRPGSDVFRISYKQGTPVSDHLRKLLYEFGQQKAAPKRRTKAEVEKMLTEQLAMAEEQKSELVVASPSNGLDWTSLLTVCFGAAVLFSTAALVIQKWRHRGLRFGQLVK